MTGPPTYSFIDKHIKQMKSPEKIGVITNGENYHLYIKDEKAKLRVAYSDATFWDIADFNFSDGKAYSKSDIQNSQMVAVIDEYTSNLVFGENRPIGKMIKIYSKNYQIIGVVEDVGVTRPRTHANVYLPITTSEKYTTKDIMGLGCIGLLLAKSKDQFPEVKAEFKHIIDNFQLGSYEGLTEIDGKLNSDTMHGKLRTLFEELFSIEISEDKIIYISYITIFFFFILLPTINLLYIHINRINERASEIGVRKSFGANKGILSRQFIFENLSMTVASGVLALIFSLSFFWILNNSQLIPGLQLSINIRSLALILMLWMFFGIVTGLLPAMRMGSMRIIDALHQHNSHQYIDFIIWKAKSLKILLAFEFALAFVGLAAICAVIFHFQKNNSYPLGFDYKNVYQISAIQYDKNPGFFGGGAFNKEIIDRIKGSRFIESYSEWRGNEPYHKGHTQISKIAVDEQDFKDVHFTYTGLDMDKVFKLNIIAGRWFEKSDKRPDYYPVVINQSLKERLFNDQNAIGRKLHHSENHFQVIGVIDHYKYHGEFSKPVDIMLYMNSMDNISINSWGKPRTDFFRVKPSTSNGEVMELARNLSAAFPDHEIEITPLEAEREKYFSQTWGPIVSVFIVFSFVVLIVLLGLFGVLWYNISLRKTEIGLRRAVGANRGRIFIQVIREMLSWASAGIIVGILLFAQLPLLNLYSIERHNFIFSIASAAIIIYGLVTICSLIPGIQAAKIQPAEALHEE
jgi:putative ABC transport system permease protein